MRGFFRCACGKLHAISGVRTDSVCTCGRGLIQAAFKAAEREIPRRQQPVAHRFEPTVRPAGRVPAAPRRVSA